MTEHALRRANQTADLLIDGLSRNPDGPALILEDGQTISGRELADEASRYAQALALLDLEPDARVGLLSRNRPEVVHVLNGLIFAGLCLVPLHPMGSVEDFVYIVQDCGIECLIFDAQAYEAVAAELLRRCPGIRIALALGSSAVAPDLIARAAAQTAAPLVAPGGDPEAIERISYSGGTTGVPKGILLSRRAMAHTWLTQHMEWDWPETVRSLVCTPLSHTGAAMIVPTLLRGGAVLVVDGFEPEKIMRTIERHRVSCVIMVPTMIYSLLDHPRFGAFDLSSLQSIFYGASAISPARLREGIEKLGPVFFQFYGQSEAPLNVTVLKRRDHDPDNLQRLASCGRAPAGARVSLLDDAGLPVPDGTPGEICVQGPMIMSGYVNKPEETAQALAGGWLHTGDIAVRDPDGFLRIVDRKKDMIVTGGFNVYPREVEDVLGAHPAVAQAAVAGVPDPRWGEAVMSMVVLRDGMTVAAAELMALVRARKGPVQTPKAILFVDAIPLSGLGKPDKKAVRAILAEHAAKGGA